MFPSTTLERSALVPLPTRAMSDRALNRASAIRFLAMLSPAERAKHLADVIAFLEQN